MIILLVSSEYKIGDYTKVNSESEKLLDVKLEVNFYDHISDLCEKKKLVEKSVHELESLVLWDSAK